MSNLLDIRGLSFAYPGAEAVLNGVNLTLSQGQRCALVGANGAGKSTLFKLILGLLPASAGVITAFGQDRKTEADFIDLRRHIGLVFQDPDDQLFCPTVAEDIAFGPLNQGKSVQEAQTITHDLLHALGLSHLAQRITYRLSGGEKRLIALGTVLAMQPDILLLDEPTNDLDPENEARLIEILNGLPQAMLVISHSQSFREAVGAQPLYLRDGRLGQ
jgi:cobalt/nickel transport system ATP-binding protein